MKKLLICLLALLMLTGAAMAEVARKGDLISAGVEADFPGWQLVGESTYGSGRWEGEPAHHCEVFLMQVEGGFLRFRRLHVIMNPIEQGDPVPWEVTDYAPVPLTQEAEARLAAMKPADVLRGWKFLLREDALPGSAEFLLREGETLSELTGFADILVGLVKDGEGRMGLRIGHWDGTQYTRVTATAMSRYVGINEIHSHSTGLELYVDDDKQLWVFPSTEEPDAPWQVGIVFAHDEEYFDDGSYVIGTDFLCTYDTYAYRFFEDCQHNDGFRYGTPAFPVLLDGLDLSGVPANLAAATELLDATGYACTKADGVPLYDAPEGTVLGSAYARLVGRVVSEQDGWAELRIGDEVRGMTAFFRAEDLAFAGEVNQLLCGFPSFDTPEDWDAEQALPGVTEALAGDGLWGMQLIARAADGGWLVLVNEDFVIKGSEDGFIDVGAPWHEIYAQWEAEWAEEEEEW
ncbi:MAG: hypothetical protein E7327_09380 [Clostridiales bacterium]|nr:hypothetical protein [Clostridiales bacterium]